LMVEPDEGHPIQVVVRRTGLSPHVIRVWEKRYAAVEPMRTATNRRRYSDADIERLQLLVRATQLGRSIGQIAALPTERLRELVQADSAATLPASTAPSPSELRPAQSHLDECLAAVERFDAARLEDGLMQARMALSQPAFIEQLIAPLMDAIGNGWRDGALRIAHEHLASAVVRTFLWGLNRSPDLSASAPTLIVTTPVGQLHEIGALMAASTAVADGWNVIYLGANLPAEEIAAAAQHQLAKAVGLSLVYPTDDPRVGDELTMLRRYLGGDVALLVGGRGRTGYKEVLDDIGAVWLSDMASLRDYLETLRSGSPR
jgi:DNA-binding transcriptional MerR regulator/methylmalonyl-CoA mutase cobalamin-binding subunit